MEKIKWSSEFSVGNRYIDNQHQEIIAMINNLIKVPSVPIFTHSELLSDTLNAMMNYAQKHFRDEESLMQTFAFPAYEEHKNLHKEYLEKTIEFCQDTFLHTSDVYEEVLQFLIEWWTSHILEQDAKLKGLIPESVLPDLEVSEQ